MLLPSDSPYMPMQWHDGLLLGYAPMDGIHEEFVACVSALNQASDDRLPTILDSLAEHCVRHFREEDNWMEQTSFPARECHMNVLRVHAHVAHPALYAAADAQGLLLWQDFPLQ